jgi:hypothetical protein
MAGLPGAGDGLEGGAPLVAGEKIVLAAPRREEESETAGDGGGEGRRLCDGQ